MEIKLKIKFKEGIEIELTESEIMELKKILDKINNQVHWFPYYPIYPVTYDTGTYIVTIEGATNGNIK